jgi:putative membrane protein
MMGGFGGLGVVEGLLGLFVFVILLAVLAALAYWLWHRYGNSMAADAGAPPATQKPASARQILDTRYARGELTREEYQTMVEDLKS